MATKRHKKICECGTEFKTTIPEYRTHCLTCERKTSKWGAPLRKLQEIQDDIQSLSSVGLQVITMHKCECSRQPGIICPSCIAKDVLQNIEKKKEAIAKILNGIPITKR